MINIIKEVPTAPKGTAPQATIPTSLHDIA